MNAHIELIDPEERVTFSIAELDLQKVYPQTPRFGTAGPALLRAGFKPIPVNGKRPVTKKWDEAPMHPDQIAIWSEEFPRLNTGLRTDDLVAVDLDIYNPRVIEEVEASFVARFGKGLKQLGEYPKRLLLYSAKAPGLEVTSPVYKTMDGFEHRVEILGMGQQFVAYGIHPNTRRPYEWVGDGPLDIERWQLPVLDRDEVAEWVRGELNSLLFCNGFTPQTGGSPTATTPSGAPLDPDDRVEQRQGAGIAQKQKNSSSSALRYPEVPRFGTAGPALLQAGFKPIPVNGKRPVIKKWEEAPMHPDQIGFWAAEFPLLNTGLRTEDLVAVDIDIYHHEVADAVEAAFVARFGPGLKRLGETPKRLLLYGAQTPGLKITSPLFQTVDGVEHKVEILGDGQQFVAYGIHPDTLRPYEWVGDGPLDIERWQLNVLDRDEVAKWVARDLRDILLPKGFLPKIGGSATTPSGVPLDPDDPFDRIKQRHDDVSLADLAWMLEHLEADHCDDRDSWRNAVFAVHHQFHGTEQEEEALDLVDAWSQKSAKYTAGCVHAIWNKTHEQRLGLATMGTLKAWLGDAWKGYKRTAVAEKVVAQVADWGTRIKAADEPTLLGPLAAEIREAKLTDIDRSALEKHYQNRLKELKGVAIPIGDVRKALAPPAAEERPAKVKLEMFLPNIAVPQLDPYSFPHTRETKLGVQLKASLDNMCLLMEGYGITAHYDVIRKKAVIHIPGLSSCPDKADTVALEFIKSLAAINDMPSQRADSLAVAIASGNPRNVVADFIQMLPWDGIDRLAQLQNTLTVREGFPVAVRDLMIRKWLISAVAACRKPEGFYSKGVLVLQGAQSLGKSPWFMRLLPESHRHEYILTGAVLDPDSKDSVKTAVSHWITELGEVDATMRKADIARLKAFLSNPIDKFRLPYDHTDSVFQRRTVFAASVNPEEFLQDETGNLRWWVLPVVHIDYKHTIDMQQLWAQVATLYESGERWWLEQAEEQELDQWNTGHVVKSAIADLLAASVDMNAPPEMWRRLAAGEVLLELGFKTPTNAHAKECGRALRSQFGEPGRTKGLAKWLVPPIVVHGSGQLRHEGFLASAFDD